MYYILDDNGNPVAEPNHLAWAMWFQTAERQVARVELPDGIVVSTVFLGIDHNFGDGPPHLFETMVFGGEHDQAQVRYATKAGALVGHAAAVKAVSGEG